MNKQWQKLLLKTNGDTRELHYNKEQLKLLLKAAVTQQSYITKQQTAVKNEMLFTPTVTQGGYITINRTMVVTILATVTHKSYYNKINNGGCYFNQH